MEFKSFIIFFIVQFGLSAAHSQSLLSCSSLFDSIENQTIEHGPIHPSNPNSPSARSYKIETEDGPIVYHVLDETPSTVGLPDPSIFLTKLSNSFEGTGAKHVNSKDPDALENNSKVNCHGYAAILSQIPGLPTRDVWIQDQATPRNLNHSPLRVLLKTYFVPVATYSHADSNFETAFRDPKIQPGDWVVFSRITAKEKIVLHSGIAIPTPAPGQQVWVRSKLGIGITVDNPISMMYAGGFTPGKSNEESKIWMINHIEVHRRK